jgi:hypothetical protein
MHSLRIVLVSCTLLLTLLLQGQQQRDSVLNRVISVNASNLPVTVILDKITTGYGIFFSYDALLIDNEQRISLLMENKTVDEVLRELFKGDQYRFLGKNNHIIISDREEGAAVHPRDTLTSRPYFVISGKIRDQKTGESLSYVSISLSDRPVGTISNADGNFLLKLPEENKKDTVMVSTVGYARMKRPAGDFRKDEVISLQPVSVKIREIKVKAVSVSEILHNFRENIRENYASGTQLLTGFYRETLKQDEEFINVSEAVLEILKAPYDAISRNDRVHLLKARKSPEVRPFHWVNFKLQGGPRTIIMLDVVKTMETFLDPGFADYYHYSVQQVIWYKNHPAYVIRFRPVKEANIPCFEGEMYIEKESYALLYARFALDDAGLEMTGQSFIIKKPGGFRVKPQFVRYQIDFSEFGGKWHLHTAHASIAFKVRSRNDRVNSVFYSVSDLLITDVDQTDLKRFPVKDLFTVNDIFAEFTQNYDEAFWENYNIIKPDEDLQLAIRRFVPGSEKKKELIEQTKP